MMFHNYQDLFNFVSLIITYDFSMIGFLDAELQLHCFL